MIQTETHHADLALTTQSAKLIPLMDTSEQRNYRKLRSKPTKISMLLPSIESPKEKCYICQSPDLPLFHCQCEVTHFHAKCLEQKLDRVIIESDLQCKQCLEFFSTQITKSKTYNKFYLTTFVILLLLMIGCMLVLIINWNKFNVQIVLALFAVIIVLIMALMLISTRLTIVSVRWRLANQKVSETQVNAKEIVKASRLGNSQLITTQ